MIKLNKENMTKLASTQASTADYDITKEYSYYPLQVEDKVFLAAAMLMQHGKGAENHTTVLATTSKDEWYVWCGDEIAEGSVELDKLNSMIVDATAALHPHNEEMVKNHIEALYDSKAESDSCPNLRFASNLKAKLSRGDNIDDIARGGNIFCEHIKNMFAQMSDFEDEASKLSKMLKEAKKVSKRAKTDSAIADALANYGYQGEALFIAGPGGHGKTHTVKSYAEDHGLEFVGLQGHGQIEAIDMYGYDKKVGDTMVWFDGPVSQAARKAASGAKTLLFIDEFVNIPMRETAGLKAAFEPYKGHYYFQTSRVASVEDGIAIMEEIKVPVENLQIVAAANIGSGYASEDVDKALKQRFMFLYYEAEEVKIRKVLTSICDEKGFSHSLVDKLIQFKNLLEIKVQDGELEEAPTMRHLSRKFLGLMKDEDDLEDVAMSQILQFVEFDVDRKPVAEQVEIVEEAIEATLA